MKFAKITTLLDQVHSMTKPERPPDSLVVILNQVIDDAFLNFEMQSLQFIVEQAAELRFGWIKDFYFVGNPAQECLVTEFRWLQVGRKDQQLFERQRNLATRRQVQKVISGFHRHDPAVEQLACRNLLSAKVIDDQATAIAFHMDWGFENSGHRTERCLKMLQFQFASDNNRRALDADPAIINALFVGNACRLG